MNQTNREIPMKKVGREVLFLQTTEDIPRIGEGSFLRLKDGTIMFACTEYFGTGFHDHDSANIIAIYSYDEGETWTDKKILIQKDPEALNVMSVSLLRLQNGEILLFHGRKEAVGDKIFSRKILRKSTDEGKTWTEPREIIRDEDWYHILNNDRVIQLKSGRILMAVARKAPRKDLTPKNGEALMFFYSDDNGETWHDTGNLLEMPFENLRGFEEPGVFQHKDGSIWCYTRTNIGCQFETVSYDDGMTWTTPKPNVFFTGARSPMHVKNVGDRYTVALFNPISLYTGRNLGKLRGRAPYLLAVSETDGVGHDAAGFSRLYYLEDDLDNDYCYPAIIDGDGYFLAAYYHSNGSEKPLNCTRITKVLFDEIAE